MFPATVDEWAAPLDGDDSEVAMIRPLLEGTRLREAQLRRVSATTWTTESSLWSLL